MTADLKENALADQTEFRASIDKAEPKGKNEQQQALYTEFATKDEEWKEYHTKKLLRKVDIRLLPCLVIMYLLNILDRR